MLPRRWRSRPALAAGQPQARRQGAARRLDESARARAPGLRDLHRHAPLERLQQTTSTTILLGEQNVTFALPHADRVYLLEHARILWEGTPARFAEEMGTGYL